MIGEPGFPESRCQIHDVTGRMLADALQYIHQVGVRIQVVQFAGGDQALDDPQVFGTEFGPAKKPIFSVMPMLA